VATSSARPDAIAGARGQLGGDFRIRPGRTIHHIRVFSDFSDHDLQFFQKGIEPAGKFTDFIFFDDFQTPGQIALSLGNIFDHVHRTVDGNGDRSRTEKQGNDDGCQQDNAQARRFPIVFSVSWNTGHQHCIHMPSHQSVCH
jgi:hypothetical protein